MSQHPVGTCANMIHYGTIGFTGQRAATQTHLYTNLTGPCCAPGMVLTHAHPHSPPETLMHSLSSCTSLFCLCVQLSLTNLHVILNGCGIILHQSDLQ